MHSTVRSRSSSALAVAAAVGLLLAGCSSSDETTSSASTTTAATTSASSPAAQSSTDSAAGSTSASGVTCGYDAADTVVAATSAQDQGGTVEVTAYPAHFSCGGANNGHFETDADAITLRLAPSAQVELLAGSGPDLDPTPLPPADFPARLAERTGALFQVDGPDTAVTGLTELYQP